MIENLTKFSIYIYGELFKVNGNEAFWTLILIALFQIHCIREQQLSYKNCTTIQILTDITELYCIHTQNKQTRKNL